jgi:hypothetical protein
MVDKRRFERVLDITAVVAVAVFVALTSAGVLTQADTGWSIGLFTGWMLRHLLR